MHYGNHWCVRDGLYEQERAATMALGEVLSNPAGCVLLNELGDARHFADEGRDRYDAMVSCGKRPSKRREGAYGSYRDEQGRANGLKDALVLMVRQAGNWEFGRRAALDAINFELEQGGDASTELYRRCMSLAYER